MIDDMIVVAFNHHTLIFNNKHITSIYDSMIVDSLKNLIEKGSNLHKN